MQITIVTEWSMHLLTGTILIQNNTHTLLNEEIHQIIDSYHQLLIIAGVTRHWIRYDNTKLAAPQQEAAQIQEKTTHGTSCKETYQDAN